MTTRGHEGTSALSETARWLRSLGSLQGTAPSLDVTHLPGEPTSLFLGWLREAVHLGVPEPRAATLATVGVDGIPDARILILKDVSTHGWAVAAPRSARNAAQLAARPAAALNFWWQPILRAVRVRGPVVEATREQIEADLAARPTKAVPSADDWMLWWIQPVRVEFWQGAVSRNHTRIVYETSNGSWTRRVVGEAQDIAREGGEQ